MFFFTFSYTLIRSMLLPLLPIQDTYDVCRICALLAIVSEGLAQKEAELLGWRQWAVVAFGLLVVFIAPIHWGATQWDYVLFVVLIICARHTSFEVAAKAAVAGIAVATCIACGACLFGVTRDVIWQSADRLRHGLGMRYPSYLQHILFYLSLYYLYLSKGRIKVLPASVLLVLAVLANSYTDARNPFILTIVLFVLAGALRALPTTPQPVPTHRWPAVVLTCVAACIIFYGIVLMVIYDPTNKTMATWDAMLSTRLTLTHRNFVQYGIQPWGTPTIPIFGGSLNEELTVASAGVNYNFIDNEFCYELLVYGWIFFAGVTAGMLALTYTEARRGNWYIVLIILLVLLHSSIDKWMFSQLDLFPLLIGTDFMAGRSPQHQTSGAHFVPVR